MLVAARPRHARRARHLHPGTKGIKKPESQLKMVGNRTRLLQRLCQIHDVLVAPRSQQCNHSEGMQIYKRHAWTQKKFQNRLCQVAGVLLAAGARHAACPR